MADPQAAAPGVVNPVWSRKTKAAKFVGLARTTAAFQSEATAVVHASKSNKFVRSFEGAPCDGAVIVGQATSAQAYIPTGSTDRHFIMMRRHAGQSLQNAILLDFKSLQWRTKVTKSETELGGDRFNKMLQAKIELSKDQIKKCQVIVLSNYLEPEWVAVIPRPYLEETLRDPDSIKWRSQQLHLGVMASTMLQKVALPPSLIPFTMPNSKLGEALDNLAACSEHPGTAMYNPYTGLSYGLCQNWQPDCGNLDEIFPATSTEHTIRKKMWEVFRQHESTTGFTVNIPEFQPLNSDLRFDHTSGVSLFIEIKIACFKVTDIGNGRQRFHHKYRLPAADDKQSAGYFTFMKDWDYMLTMTEDGEKGYLIARNEFPADFWHKIIDDEEWLTTDYASASFLSAREVKLDRSDAVIRRDICRILSNQNLANGPNKPVLTWRDVVSAAGPCPQDLLGHSSANRHGRQGGVGADEQDNELGVIEVDAKANVFTTAIVEMRHKVEGGRETVREAQLFDLLLHECAVRGSGCPIFLGMYHPMGTVGLMRHKWSQEEMENFRRNGKPPLWIGLLDNDTVLVTVLQRLTRWRLPHEYAPDEGTNTEVKQAVVAHPCLVVCTGFPREIEHMRQQVWLVPSDFLPGAHLGHLKAIKVNKVGSINYRLPLFLKDQVSVDKLAFDTHALHDVLMQFLHGEDRITIGDGVDVHSAMYLRTVREVRVSSDVNFKTCLKGLDR